MSIKFKLSPITNTIKKPRETKYYPRVVHRATIDFDEMATLLSERGTVTRSDCYAVLVGLSDLIAENIKEGNLVKLDGLGSFHISVKGTGTFNQEDLGKNLIQKANVTFHPGKVIKKVLKTATFQRIRIK